MTYPVDKSTTPELAFQQTAQDLSTKNLGKQRVEGRQILHSIVGYAAYAWIKGFQKPDSMSVHDYLLKLRRLYERENYVLAFDEQCENYMYLPAGTKEVSTGWIFKLGFSTHAAVRMWFNRINALKQYINIIITTWINRGYVNNLPIYRIRGEIIYPSWIYDLRVFTTHRISLVKKFPDIYGPIYGPIETIFWTYRLETYFLQYFIELLLNHQEKRTYFWPVD